MKHIVFVAVLWGAFTSPAFAVRPFVTDDARIVDYGQVETETWLETTRDPNGVFAPAPGLNVMAGFSSTDWLEIIVGSGIGRNSDGGLAIGNPTLAAKVLFIPITDTAPGFAISTATVFNHGRGDMYDEGRVHNLIGMNTWKFNNSFLHVNYGIRHDDNNKGRAATRLYWGLGFETPFYGEDVTLVGEVFAGDPLIPNAPSLAAQWGVRYHHRDNTQFDLTFGVDPELDHQYRRTGSYAYTVQLGMRFVFDSYTRDGRPGNSDGAPGLFSR